MKKRKYLYSTSFVIGLSFNLLAQSKPNIVFILADDLGWTDLGCMGSDFYETPHIDQLRKEGMLFTQAYSNAPNSAPSRASIMTGLYTPRHGVYTVSPPDRGKAENRKLIPMPNNEELSNTFITIPQVLKQNGYRTIHIGKWHLGNNDSINSPMAHGFDINIGGGRQGAPYSYFYPYGKGDKKLPGLSPSDDTSYLTDRLTNEAIKQIEISGEQPFFLYFSHYTVHTPLEAKPEIEERYRNKKSGIRHKNATYAAMIQSLDESVGRIIKTLKRRGLYHNTLIIFMSDNGGMLNGVSDNTPLRGGKGTPYEGGNRVPLIISYSNKIEQNSLCTEPVVGIDIFPTILDFTHISIAKQLDGVSLKKRLTSDVLLPQRNLYFFFPAYLESYDNKEAFRATPYSSIISNNRKLIYFFENNQYVLYNLSDDIGEQKDLSNSEREMALDMLNRLKEWQKKVNAPFDFKRNFRYRPVKRV